MFWFWKVNMGTPCHLPCHPYIALTYIYARVAPNPYIALVYKYALAPVENLQGNGIKENQEMKF
jgi:hypothetical protein